MAEMEPPPSLDHTSGTVISSWAPPYAAMGFISIDATFLLVLMLLIPLIVAMDRLLFRPALRSIITRERLTTGRVRAAEKMSERTGELRLKHEEELERLEYNAICEVGRRRFRAQENATRHLHRARAEAVEEINDTLLRLQEQEENIVSDADQHLDEVAQNLAQKLLDPRNQHPPSSHGVPRLMVIIFALISLSTGSLTQCQPVGEPIMAIRQASAAPQTGVQPQEPLDDPLAPPETFPWRIWGFHVMDASILGAALLLLLVSPLRKLFWERHHQVRHQMADSEQRVQSAGSGLLQELRRAQEDLPARARAIRRRTQQEIQREEELIEQHLLQQREVLRSEVNNRKLQERAVCREKLLAKATDNLVKRTSRRVIATLSKEHQEAWTDHFISQLDAMPPRGSRGDPWRSGVDGDNRPRGGP